MTRKNAIRFLIVIAVLLAEELKAILTGGKAQVFDARPYDHLIRLRKTAAIYVKVIEKAMFAEASREPPKC